MNSTNIKVISEEIQRLKDQVHAIDVEVPDPSDATDGQILSVDDGKYVISDPELPAVTAASPGDVLGLVGEAKAPEWITPFTPADYSETETATGYKWIDGKDIYFKTFSGTMPSTGGDVIFDSSTSLEHIITIKGDVTSSGGYIHSIERAFDVYYDINTTKIMASMISAYYSATYNITVYYTKPTPVPSNETQSTKKKTTKKGE